MTTLHVLGNYPPLKPHHLNKETFHGTRTNNKILNHENIVRAAALGGSIVGSGLYLYAFAKHQNKNNFKISHLLNQNFKNPIKVMSLATSSVIGGLIGGVLTDDKSKRKGKLKEAIHQFLGNIVMPISIVGASVAAIEKRNYPKTKGIILSGISSIIGVVTGVTVGNALASKANEKIFKEEDPRRIKPKDFGIHVDDLMTLIALTQSGPGIEAFIAKALPAIFLICGYEAGTSHLHKKHHKR